MGFLIFLVVVAFIVIYIFIQVKINNLKYRAKQHILKDTGISSSNINEEITKGMEKKQLEKFLAENSNFTEESIKDLLKQYTVQMFNRNQINEFSQIVCEKIQKDSKMDKMQSMEFRRVNINHYSNGKLCAIVVYTDNRDEYNVYLYCSVVENEIQLDKYQINKGAVVGF